MLLQYSRPMVPVSGLPAFLVGMLDKSWSTVAAGGINTVNPNFSGVPADQGRVIDKWSGGAAYGPNFRLNGGGHGDYGGNEIYDLNLSLNVPAWTMPVGPSVATGGTQGANTAADFADGAPRACHTQQRLVMTPTRFFMAGSDNMFNDGSASSTVFYSNRPNGAWTALGKQLTDAEFTAPSFGFYGGASIYDPVSDWVWMFSQQTSLDTQVAAVLINNTTLATRKILGYLPAGYQWGVIAHDLRKLFIGSGLGDLFVYDITSTPNAGDTITRTVCTVNNPGALAFLPNATADHGGAVYHKASRAILCWNNNGANIIKVAIPADPMAGTYDVSLVTPNPLNAVTPSAQTATGTFGRFNIVTVAGVDLLVLCNGYTESTYVYRLPAAGL